MNKPITAKSSNSHPQTPATNKAFSSKSNQGIIAAQKPQMSRPAQLPPALKTAVPSKTSTPWTVKAASRIYRTEAQQNNGQVPKGALGAKAMSAATKGASHFKSQKK